MAKTSEHKTGKQVVIVEDDPEIAEMLRIVLEANGIAVHITSDGRSGLERVRAVRPDGVVLDIMMPKMNGYEVCAAIQSDPDLAQIPIMVITGLVETQDSKTEEEWRNRLSVADFVVKPLNMDTIGLRLRKLLQIPEA